MQRNPKQLIVIGLFLLIIGIFVPPPLTAPIYRKASIAYAWSPGEAGAPIKRRADAITYGGYLVAFVGGVFFLVGVLRATQPKQQSPIS